MVEGGGHGGTSSPIERDPRRGSFNQPPVLVERVRGNDDDDEHDDEYRQNETRSRHFPRRRQGKYLSATLAESPRA